MLNISRFIALMIFMALSSHVVLAEPVDRIVAVVNDEVITQSELDARVAQASAQLHRQGTALPPASQLQHQMLDRLVVEKLQLQEARNTGLHVDDSTLQRAIQTIADNNKLSIPDLRTAVEKEEGLSWDRFREDIRTEITLSRLRENEVDSKVVVSDAEVDAFLASPEAAVGGHEYLVSHILLRASEGATPEQWNTLQKRADEVMRLINQGDDFAKLAAAFSDAQDAMQGGSLDWQPLERLPVLFADEVPKLKKGDVSPLLRSAAGLHIFKLVDIRDAQVKEQKIEQTHARHILLRASDTLNDTDAKRRLNELRDRLKNGADFAELARLNSTDITAAKGGDLGWLSPGDTVPEFERAMNALKPGEISEPVQSPFGWHLIQVLERRTADVTTDRRRASARNALHDRKADETFDDWLSQLRDQAYVDLRLDQ
ncbi:MAG TPA: peptidylprolyl isomerase [Rhodocyclaceae bacterium]|nr:peptidylprolyl isomerase [Rhodocyclaceae bacterium]